MDANEQASEAQSFHAFPVEKTGFAKKEVAAALDTDAIDRQIAAAGTAGSIAVSAETDQVA